MLALIMFLYSIVDGMYVSNNIGVMYRNYEIRCNIYYIYIYISIYYL